MPRKRHTPEEIVRKLRQADVYLSNGLEIGHVFQKLAVREATFHRWRSQYGGMKAEGMKRLKQLEKETVRLKKALADLALDNQILKEVSRGDF